MSLAAPKPPSRAWVLARNLLACAWPRHRLAGAPKLIKVLPAKVPRRREIAQEEFALIDELSLLIGPAFAAAMERSALEDKAKKPSR
jgi:hypothetical protein